jgi:hypothetical protein
LRQEEVVYQDFAFIGPQIIFILLKKTVNLIYMQVQIDIGFEQIVSLVKKLPAKQWAKLKSEIERNGEDVPKNQDLEAFLLQAPTFSQKHIDTISETRNAVNQWRKK